ncbi:MAG TPA: hypothetical protein VGH89_01755 [Pseudonocardia sp.]
MSAKRGQPPPRQPESWVDRIDWPIVARSASRGFTVLVLSDLLYLLVARLGPTIGLVWLVLGSAAAFAIAAWQAGPADSPELTGAVSSVFSYTLSVPLVYMAERRIVWTYVLIFVVGAIIVGSLVGHYAAAKQAPEPKRRPK